MMKTKPTTTNILLFGDKRHRETRLRRSVFSIDDTDFLMEVRSARRRSIETMTNDDLMLSSPTNWNRVWNDFSISPDNIRNIFPLNNNKSKNGISPIAEKENTMLQDPIPDISRDSEQVSVDESASSKTTSSPNSSCSSLPKPSSSPVAQQQDENKTPAWYNRLGALARRERQQEKDYHNTLDEHHKAKQVKALRQHHNQFYLKNWRRQSSRDGLDFSRDVALALRHDSIYAMADSFTQLPSCDGFAADALNEDESGTIHKNNGYVQDTRPAANPKTKKCVMDLIA